MPLPLPILDAFSGIYCKELQRWDHGHLLDALFSTVPRHFPTPALNVSPSDPIHTILLLFIDSEGKPSFGAVVLRFVVYRLVQVGVRHARGAESLPYVCMIHSGCNGAASLSSLIQEAHTAWRTFVGHTACSCALVETLTATQRPPCERKGTTFKLKQRTTHELTTLSQSP